MAKIEKMPASCIYLPSKLSPCSQVPGFGEGYNYICITTEHLLILPDVWL